MSDPDVCQRQLDAVNNEIERVNAANKTIDDDKETTKRDYERSEREYKKKQSDERNALAAFTSSKQGNNHHSQGQGAWSGHTDCENHCRGWAQNTYNDSSVQVRHNNRCNARDMYGNCLAGRWECLCIGPDVNDYKSKKTAYETAKKATATALTDMESKKAVYQTSLQKPYTMANISVACCTNTTVCAPGAECDNIKQSCQAEISAQKEEKTQKEAQAKADEETKIAAEKAKVAAGANNTGASVPNRQSTSSSSGSSDNTLIYAGGGGSSSLSCCSIIIIVVVILMMNK
jgi:hypothetical protein